MSNLVSLLSIAEYCRISTYLSSKILITSSQPCIARLWTERVLVIMTMKIGTHVSMHWSWGCLTCSVQRRPARLAHRPPDVRCHEEQVLYDWRVALPAGDVEGVPAVFVPQGRVGPVVQQILDHVEVSPSAGHHQGSPERERRGNADNCSYPGTSTEVGFHITSLQDNIQLCFLYSECLKYKKYGKKINIWSEKKNLCK